MTNKNYKKLIVFHPYLSRLPIIGELFCGGTNTHTHITLSASTRRVRADRLFILSLSLFQVVNKAVLRKKHVTGAPSALALVEREIEVLDSLPRHPNLATLVEVIDDPSSDKLYICLEHAGCRVGSLPPLRHGEDGAARDELLSEVLAQAARGVGFLHRHGVVHGDLKADHLLCEEDPTFRVRIVDFGSSSRLRVAEGQRWDLVSKSPGTPAYTAPECCEGGAYGGTKADVWALGVSLYLLRYGGFPFSSTTACDVYEEIRACRGVELPPPGPNASENLTRALQGMLQTSPDDRLTAGGILETLLGETDGLKGLGSASVDEIEASYAREVLGGGRRDV